MVRLKVCVYCWMPSGSFRINLKESSVAAASSSAGVVTDQQKCFSKDKLKSSQSHRNVGAADQSAASTAKCFD